MRMKSYFFLFLAVMLLACKPAAQATSAEARVVSAPAQNAAPEVQNSAEGAQESPDPAYDDEGEIRRRSPSNITEEYYSCLKNVGYNTVESMTCMTAEKDRQDKRLNNAYKKLQEMLGPDAKRNLMEAQRAWLKFRDAEDQFESSISEDEIIDNAKFTESELFRLCRRANELEAHMLYVEIR